MRPIFRSHQVAREQQGADQRQRREAEENDARLRGGDRVAEDALEIGETVVAAETGFVAEEEQHRRVGQRLRDDREIDALDARTEGEVAEDESDQRRHDEHQQRHPEKAVATDPEPRQFLPVEEDHEIRQIALVTAVTPDLAHQVHAEGVAAEGEEQPMAERENAAVAPDQVHRHGDDRVAEDLAGQGDEVGRQVQRMLGWQHQVHDRHGNQRERRRRGRPAANCARRSCARDGRGKGFS
jgi:hypothetical protein